MKGIVFTELFDMVEDKFSPDMLDDVLDGCTLESGGAYTTVGTYDHKELLEIVRVCRNSLKTAAMPSNSCKAFMGIFMSK